MKKVLFASIFMTFTLSVFAQTLNFGLKAGINFQTITTDSYNGSIVKYGLSDSKSDAKMGFNIGAFARLGSSKLYLQPELLYSVNPFCS